MTNPTKTVAQVGYEAYSAQTGGKSLATGQDLPPFAELTPGIQEAWQAAGTAVIAAAVAGAFKVDEDGENEANSCGADAQKAA